MHDFTVKRPLKVRPRTPRQGEISFGVRAALFRARDEIALGIRFISDRKLFGFAYWLLQPDYFDTMARKSGVLISPFVPTRAICRSAERPGDIDLLVVPYENEELILSRTLAIETKALRAQYARQNRSPNQFGFRQGLQLLGLGFPYVAVAHLIVSDQSPESAWQEMLFGRVLDDTLAIATTASWRSAFCFWLLLD